MKILFYGVKKVKLKCSSRYGHSIICKNPGFPLIRGPRTVIGQTFGAVMANANMALCSLDEQQEGKYRNAQHSGLHKDMQVGNNP